MMFSGRAEQASINASIWHSGKDGFSLLKAWLGLNLFSPVPLLDPFSSSLLFSNASALCSLYPNTYSKIEADRYSNSKGFTVRHLDLDLHCITCQLFKLLNLSKLQFSQVTRCYKKCLHHKIIVTI